MMMKVELINICEKKQETNIMSRIPLFKSRLLCGHDYWLLQRNG